MSLREIAYERAQIRFMEQCYIEHFRLCRKNGDMHKLPGSMQDDTFQAMLKDIDNYNSLQLRKNNMLTISPREGVCNDWKPLVRLMELLVKRKNLLLAPTWCYEQRSTDLLNPHGFHVHVAYQSCQSKSEVIRRVYADLQKVFDDSEKNWIHVNVDSPKAYEYVKGDKIAEKEGKIKVDEAHRRRHGLKDYYEVSESDAQDSGASSDAHTQEKA